MASKFLDLTLEAPDNESKLLALVRPPASFQPPVPPYAESEQVQIGFDFGKKYASEGCEESALRRLREDPEFEESILDYATPQGAGFAAAAHGDGKLPPYVVAWRMGCLPEPGKNSARRSRNHVDRELEHGVSVVEVYGAKNPHVRNIPFLMSTLDRLHNDWPRVVVAGWLSTFRGRDGEPLLCGSWLLDGTPKCPPNPFRGCLTIGFWLVRFIPELGREQRT